MATRRKKDKHSASLGPQERLDLFRKRVNELEDLRLIRLGMKMDFLFTLNSDSKPLQCEANEPDEDDLRSFLLLFRHFISESEPIFLNRIFNDCLRFLTDDDLKGEVKKARCFWQKRMSSGPVKILRDAKPISPEYMLDLWINGRYFHNDAQKASELEGLLSGPGPLVRMQFLINVPALTSIIQLMGSIVTRALDEHLFQIPSDAD